MQQIIKLSENSKQYFENYIQILDEMELEMQEINATDNISETYVMQMLPYFKAIAKFNENILTYTTNPNVEIIAKSVLVSSPNSLKKLLTYCKNIKNSNFDNGIYLLKFRKIFDQMTRSMRKIVSTNNINKCYLLSMLTCQENGIYFAKNILNFDICFEIKEYLQKYIKDTTLSIQTIKNLLNKQNI